MDPSSTTCIVYANDASHFSRNLASAASTIFTPSHMLVHSNGVCIGSTTNNQAEYDAVIGFLVNSISHCIFHLHVRLYSLLLVMQLNGVYHVHNKVIFRKYLHVKMLVREFQTIIFSQVPRAQNNYVDTIANNILDWHLSHVYHKRQP